ncbi:hypothetical protein CALCODRAFT_494946 [Calocera cornea HHB12733]|uniref:NET domain-containing protein n=1 Tax=Calocera cornea HHB12733 TaxID=1353952 RepID=A0A165GTC8_9BASI|nr:hypothetical protein CALCODRAFT_494946 [Calocera cornea HHB12733]
MDEMDEMDVETLKQRSTATTFRDDDEYKLVKTVEATTNQKSTQQRVKKSRAKKNRIRNTVKPARRVKDRGAQPPGVVAIAPTTGPSKQLKVKPRDKNMKEESNEDGPVDFCEKRELAEEIVKLEGKVLKDVIAVLEEAILPEIPNGEDDCEIEIDSLPPSVIRKLYRMVVEPARKQREAEQIRLLEVRLSMFTGGGAASVPAASRPAQQQGMMDVDETSSDDDHWGSE